MTAIPKPSSLHIAIGIHVIPFASVPGPSGLHGAGTIEDEGGTAEIESSGLHGAVAREVIPCFAFLIPALFHIAVGVHVVPFASVPGPSGLHSAGIVEKERGTAEIELAGLHGAVAREVIPCSAFFVPALFRLSAALEIVPGIPVIGPSGAHFSGRIKNIDLSVDRHFSGSFAAVVPDIAPACGITSLPMGSNQFALIGVNFG